MAGKKDKKDEKVGVEEFCRRAILRLRDTEKSRGIHTVYSGFVSAMRKYFEHPKNDDATKDWAWKTLAILAEKGAIDMHRAKGGSMIYLPGEGPSAGDSRAKKVLDTILA